MFETWEEALASLVSGGALTQAQHALFPSSSLDQFPDIWGDPRVRDVRDHTRLFIEIQSKRFTEADRDGSLSMRPLTKANKGSV